MNKNRYWKTGCEVLIGVSESLQKPRNKRKAQKYSGYLLHDNYDNLKYSVSNRVSN